MLDKPKAVSSIALKKFMEGPTKYVRNKSFVLSSGISQGEFRWFKEVCRVCEDIAEKIGSTGPLNIQLRLVNGKVRPFEINPRFSGTTSSRALTGYNEPEFYIRKYLLNDPRAADSLKIKRKGYVVKVYEERYVEYK
jgi:carbamoyl-phosphate synthase large subunit